MYYALESKSGIKLFSRKLNCVYEHNKFRRRDKVRYKEVPINVGNALLKKNRATLND